MQETRICYLGWEDPLEKEMATHSSILAWRIPWTEEPGRLQSAQSQMSDLTKPIALKPWDPIYCQLVVIIWIDIIIISIQLLNLFYYILFASFYNLL